MTDVLEERRIHPLEKPFTALTGEERSEVVKCPVKGEMALSRDLIAQNGELLLSKGHVLDASLIEQIMGFERMDGHPLTIHVHAKA